MFMFRVLNAVPYSNEQGAKDFIASLHSFVTCNLLVGLAVLVSWKQFGGRPLECMVPPDFTGAWVEYAEVYCWSQDTYYVPFSTPLANTRDNTTVDRSSAKISYYQWMPFFLLFEAACFRLPTLIWKYFASQSGMKVGEILRLATDEHNTVPEIRRENIHALCIHLQGALRFQKRLKLKGLYPHKIIRFLNLKYTTYYVTLIYFIAKFAFLMNVGIQTKLLNQYLIPHASLHQFGFDVWHSLWSGNKTWQTSGLFPRVTLCDFDVREMGNIQTHTVQCVLLLNVFTEKIFIVLWAWYVFLATLTACNLISWVFSIFSETSKEHFLINHLEMCETSFDKESARDLREVDCFIDKYLGLDGIFLLRLIGQHADVVFITELVGYLWKSHNEIEEQRHALKRMNRVLPLLVPEEKMDYSVPGSRRESLRRESLLESRRESSLVGSAREKRRASLANRRQNTLKRHASAEEIDSNKSKQFEDSSDEDTNVTSRKSSLEKGKKSQK